MGVKIESSEIIIIRFIIYYLMLSASCDIKLITCDIHHIIQSYYNNSRNNTVSDGVMDIDTTMNFKINATELEQHIMNGLNMKTKPDVNLVCGILLLLFNDLFSSFMRILRITIAEIICCF